MLVLGIDPGSAVTGFGIIKSERLSHFECLDFGCIRSSAKTEFYLRLKNIYDRVTDIILKYQPDYIALEDIFYSRNVKSALQLGQARGAAILASLNKNKAIKSYSPREVKQALTGNGAASKEQVQRMVLSMLDIKEKITPLDASDALAIAICHTNRYWTQKQMNKSLS